MGYSFKKTLVKGLWILAEVGIAGVIVYFTENSYFIGLVPLLEMGKNWLKHRKDI